MSDTMESTRRSIVVLAPKQIPSTCMLSPDSLKSKRSTSGESFGKMSESKLKSLRSGQALRSAGG